MHTDKIYDTVPEDTYFKNQHVRGYIHAETPLGYKVCFDDKYFGLLYKAEVFTELKVDQNVEVYIKNIREDMKVDLSMQPIGYRESSKEVRLLILDKLEENGDFLGLSDKSSPEEIYKIVGISKKKYKDGIGSLYKEKLISITKEGIRLLRVIPE